VLPADAFSVGGGVAFPSNLYRFEAGWEISTWGTGQRGVDLVELLRTEFRQNLRVQTSDESSPYSLIALADISATVAGRHVNPFEFGWVWYYSFSARGSSFPMGRDVGPHE